jgi:hypothetical protein
MEFNPSPLYLHHTLSPSLHGKQAIELENGNPNPNQGWECIYISQVVGPSPLHKGYTVITHGLTQNPKGILTHGAATKHTSAVALPALRYL